MQSFKFEGLNSRLDPMIKASQPDNEKGVAEMKSIVTSLVALAEAAMPMEEIPEDGSLPDHNVRVECLVTNTGGFYRRSVDVFVFPTPAS